MSPLRLSRIVGCAVAGLLWTLSTTACAGDGKVRWYPADDLSYYRIIQSAETNPRANIFSAPLAAALQSHLYRQSADKVVDTSCDAWIVLQSIEVNSSTYAFVLFCRNGRDWTALRGGGGGEAAVNGMVPSSEMDGLLSRSKGLAVGPRLGIGFDALTSYVTTYDGQSVNRFAVYGDEDGRSDTVSDFRLADGVIRDLKNAVECVKEPARQD